MGYRDITYRGRRFVPELKLSSKSQFRATKTAYQFMKKLNEDHVPGKSPTLGANYFGNVPTCRGYSLVGPLCQVDL